MTQHLRRQARVSFVLIAVALVSTAAALGWGIGQWRKHRQTAPCGPGPSIANRGELIFQTACANCHGAYGSGDGVSAATLKPPPRDFAARPWRFEPTKESIRRVILGGIPGTAMPAIQGSLADADLDALVEHVHGLATSRPTVTSLPSLEEQLLNEGGFINLQGAVPPPLIVSDTSGRLTKLADLKGKLVIVNFWGMTCVHCLKEISGLRKLEADFSGRGLIVLHVCADADNPRDAQALLDKQAPGIRSLTDETGLGIARFDVQVLPTVWLIGPDGKVVARKSGAMDWHSPISVTLVDHWLPRAGR